MDLVVILGAVWLLVLGPSLWRRYREHDSVSSVLHFHHQLRVLEDAEPRPLVRPAFRLRSLDGTVTPVAPIGEGGQPRPVLTVVGADRLPRPALACLGDDVPPSLPSTGRGPRSPGEWSVAPSYGVPTATGGGRARPVGPGGFDHVAEARRLARRRRRDILGGLVAATFVTLLIGLIPGAGLAWVATTLFAVAAAAYVALLAHHRALALERERKLRYLRPPSHGRPVDAGDAWGAASRVGTSGGYATGETSGYATGETSGYATGETSGYATGEDGVDPWAAEHPMRRRSASR